MSKKWIAMLLCAALCVSMILGACGNGGSGSADSGSGQAAPAQTTAAPAADADSGKTDNGQAAPAQTEGAASTESVIDFDEEPYTVTVELCVGRAGEEQDEKLVEDALNEILVPKANVKVDLMPVLLADHATKMSLWATTGEKIDLVMAGMMTPFISLVGSEAIQPITKELYERAPELVEAYGAMLDCVTVNGEIYALPAIMYPAEQNVFYYNAELADQYNIDVPEKCTSWDDIEYVFEQVKNSGMEAKATDVGSGTPTAIQFFDTLGDGSNYAYGCIFMGNGAADEVVNYYASDEFRTLCEKRREWIEKGYGVEDALSSGLNNGQMMKSGMIFGYFAREGSANTIQFAEQQMGVSLRGGLYSDVWVSGKHVVDYTWGVSINSERVDKCVDLLKLMYTDQEVMNLMLNGIEGREYVKTDKEGIIAYPEGVTPATSGWAQLISKIGDNKLMYQFEPMTPDYFDSLDKYRVENAQYISPAMGFTIDSADLQTQVAAVSGVVAEYKDSLRYGVVDVEETLAKFNSDLEAAGINDIIAAVNGQYQDWKNSK